MYGRARELTVALLAGAARLAGKLLAVAPVDLALDAATALDEREARLWRTRGMRSFRSALDVLRLTTRGGAA